MKVRLPPTREERRRAAIETLWRAGDLEMLAVGGKPLHKGQRDLLAAFKKSKERTFVVCTSRRWGKSIWAGTLSAEAALAGKRVLLATDTQKHIRDIIQPHIDRLFSTAPADLQPKWDNLASAYRFQGKGVIRLVGLDAGNADRARGTEEDLVVVDEAGFVAELEYFVNSVCLPQLLTTGGRLLAISTPSVSTGHYFREMCQAAAQVGAYHERTIFHAQLPDGHLKPEIVEEFRKDYERRYGPNSTPWRREYLCQFVTESSRAVVPEWTLHKDHCIGELPQPEHFDPYVSIDMGYSDLTVAIFGHWNVREQLLVVEDEIVAKHATPDVIASKVERKELELWNGKGRVRRFVDAPPIILAEFNRNYGVSVAPVSKRKAADRPFKEASLASLREQIHDHKVRIHPRCKVLLAHIEWAIWNASRTSYERPRDNAFAGDVPVGHFDALDALIYLNWSVDRLRDPYPKTPPGQSIYTHHMKPPRKEHSDTAEVLRSTFRTHYRGRRRR